MNWYQKAEDYVKEVFTESGKRNDINHFLRTVYWIKKLKPEADEGLLIAGISHDISRAFKDDEAWDKIKDKGFVDKEGLRIHQNESARIIGEFLKKKEAPSKLIARVKDLVSHHEVGGNDNQNLLMDADCISFFETNVEHFVNHYAKIFAKDMIKEKFDWMFNKISSQKRKDVCKPMYEKAMKDLINS